MLKIGKSVTCVMARPILKMKKYSPEILVGAGLIGVVTAAISAARTVAGEDYQSVLDSHRWRMHKIAEAQGIAEQYPMSDMGNGEQVETYSLKSQRTDIACAYRDITISTAKYLWPQISIMTLSIVAILSGFRIVRKRNMALVAAYNVIDQAFKGYRERVRNELGEEMDTHFMYDTEMKVGTKTIKNADGTTTKVKETEQILKGNVVSMYARLYAQDTTQQFERDPRFNWLYIKKKCDYLNDLLHSRGHVFLNEAYEELGFEHTSYGAVVGWVANKKGGTGDNYISFGHWVEKLTDVEAAGPMGSILLDFNVDGVVYDLI